MSGHHTSRTVRAATTLLVFAQALSLQLLCFCGHCPRSLALGVGDSLAQTEPEPLHACCHQARLEQIDQDAAAHQVNAQGCCGDDHSVRDLPALAPSDTPLSLPALALLTVQIASIETQLPSRQELARAWVRSTGPPGAREPFFLQYQAFLL